jgi:hypothetical protein
MKKKYATNSIFKFKEKVEFKEGCHQGLIGTILNSYWVRDFCSDMPAYDVEIIADIDNVKKTILLEEVPERLLKRCYFQ